MNKTKFVWTVPNVLSMYRIGIFPYILYLLFANNKDLFAWFIMISFVTDFLDGFIARMFNQKSAIGEKLDSIADMGTFILALSGLFKFQSVFLSEHYLLMIIYVGLYIACPLFAFIKYKKMVSFHIYAFKVTAYVQALFLMLLFMFNYTPWVFYPAMIIGIYACIEELLIILILKEPRSDVKGLYWIMKSGKNK